MGDTHSGDGDLPAPRWREPRESRDNHVPYPPQPLPRRTRRVNAPNPGCVGPVAGDVAVEV